MRTLHRLDIEFNFGGAALIVVGRSVTSSAFRKICTIPVAGGSFRDIIHAKCKYLPIEQ